MQFGLSKKTIDAICGVFSGHPFIREAILFGSRAKGNFRRGSDIDITLVENDMSLAELMQIENELDDLLLPYKIDLSQKRKIENPDLLDHINRVGKVFYVTGTKDENSL